MLVLRQLTVPSALRLIEKLVAHPAVQRDQIEFEFIPLLNPDGRALVEANGNYCWRGNAIGVDLNRNFDWDFGGAGSSQDGEEKRGDYAMSEPESTFLAEVASRGFDGFLSLHSGIEHIYIPYSDETSWKQGEKPAFQQEMLACAQRAVYRFRQSAPHRRKRFVADIAEQLSDYGASGVIYDYMAGKMGIPFTFAVEVARYSMVDFAHSSCSFTEMDLTSYISVLTCLIHQQSDLSK